MSCSNVPEAQGTAEEEVTLMPRRQKITRVDKSICQRCKVAKSLYLVRSTAYCKPCLQGFIHNRFVRQLHPALLVNHAKKTPKSHLGFRLPPQAGNVVVGLSGGAGSMAMLDLLMSNGYIGKGDGSVADKTKGERDIVWDRGYVVYVEFAGVINDMEDRMEGMRAVAEERGLEFVGLRAEDVFDEKLGGESLEVDLSVRDLPILERPNRASSSSSPTPLHSLQSLLASLPPPSRPALLSNILSTLLHCASATLPNISHLILGETSTRQAQRVISGTASGRGWALPLELADSYTLPSSKIVRLKPMREMSMKEVTIYCHTKRLSSFNERKWDHAGPAGKRGKGGIGSLEMLTEQFIAGLSVTHPATVSTINRTGDKLTFSGKVQSDLCPVCEMPVDESALEWKSRSGLTSLSKETEVVEPTSSSGPTLAPLLCYACLTTFTPTAMGKEVKADRVQLPHWIRDGVRQREVGRQKMKEEIGQYLLDND
ncbi:cytoplasmic tRNA 2-thiolation protein 2, partial [Tremellales sp. Uapishka_1]